MGTGVLSDILEGVTEDDDKILQILHWNYKTEMENLVKRLQSNFVFGIMSSFIFAILPFEKIA